MAVEDRRVTRSRTALTAAAVRLVSERGTTAIPVRDIADAADVSRQLVYLQFGDREALFVHAAIDLVERELLPLVEHGDPDPAARTLATARHFARHRSFYRAMITGSCGHTLTATVVAAFEPLHRDAVHRLFGDLDTATAADMTTFLAAGTVTLINTWLVDTPDPLDPASLADRLARVGDALRPARPRRGATGASARP